MKIIVAIDSSKYSEAALDALVDINWSPKTEIKILTVLPAGEPAFAFFGSGASTPTVQQQERLESTRTALSNRLGARNKSLSCAVSYEVAEGDAKTRILEEARRWSANMIIMGSRGSTGVDLMLLGSVSQRVLELASCPVIIVKSSVTANKHHAGSKQLLKPEFKNILVAVDNSQYSQAAICWLKSLKLKENTKLTLVTVVQSLSGSVDSLQDAVNVSELMLKHDALKSMAETKLQTMAKELKCSLNPEKISARVVEGDPREGILQAADACSADLIVMGSHGRTGLTKLFLGNVAQAVALHAHCSVAIVKGAVPQEKIDELNQSGLFVAEK